MTEMLIRVGMEVLSPERMLAWGLDFPGCFAYGRSDAEALLRFAGNLLNYGAWVNLHTEEPWFHFGNVDFRLVEAYQGGRLPAEHSEDGSIAFFEDDFRTLQQDEIGNALKVYRWQREELLAGLEFTPTELLGRKIFGETRTIQEVLLHIARTELLYLNKLELWAEPLPKELKPLDALQFSQEKVETLLPGLEENPATLEVDGELWSCRKLVRRLLWHHRVQIDAVKRLVGQPGA